MTEEQSDWYYVRQVANILGVHIKTVKRLPPIELPYYRMSKRGDRRYRKEDIDKFLQSRLINK